VINGIAVGTAYGVIGLAVVMTYKATGVVNFAQAEIGLFGTYVAWWLMERHGVYFLLALLAGIVAGALLSLVMERSTIRPLIGRSHFSIIVMTIGLWYGVNAITAKIWGEAQHAISSPVDGTVDVGGQFIRTAAIAAIAVGALIAVLLNRYFRTPAGVRMRAIAEDPVTPRLLGVDIGRVYRWSFLVAGVISVIAVFLEEQRTLLSIDGASNLIVFGVVACAVGGFASATGAYFGGILLGIASNLSGYYISVNSQTTIALVAVVAVLAVRPQGLFGEVRVREV
jgi:branched-chain amino acid transport system permease protein